MQIITIAHNTFREAVRNKVFYTLLFFSLVFAIFSVSLSMMVLGDLSHVLVNMGLANIEIFGTLIAIFVGISLVYKELEKRTIYTIISRPIKRWKFILGKYLGLVMTLVVEILIMTAIYFAVLAFYGNLDMIPGSLIAIWLIFIKLMLITSVAVFFSSISTPILSGMFTLAFYVVGSISGYLMFFIEMDMSPALVSMIRTTAFILPDFSFMDIKSLVVYQKPIEAIYVFNATVYGLLYATMVLILGIQIFEKKDLK